MEPTSGKKVILLGKLSRSPIQLSLKTRQKPKTGSPAAFFMALRIDTTHPANAAEKHATMSHKKPYKRKIAFKKREE
jgi:hypothetical protein